MKKRVNSEELIGNSQKTVEVYLKWVGVRMGVYFESAQDGPYDVVIRGDAVSVDGRDMTELQTERAHLETSCHCSGLSLHMAEVLEGSQLGEWRPVTVGAVRMKQMVETAHAEAHANPDDLSGIIADMCRCQCQAGGECSRKVCSGATALARDTVSAVDVVRMARSAMATGGFAARASAMAVCDAWLRKAEAPKAVTVKDALFRVASTRYGAVGEEKNYLYIFDVDGDVEVYFMEGAEKAWSGSADKASALVAVIKETTGDETVRVEEVRS